MGTNALPAVTVIQQALLDSETTVVEAAASALKELGIGRFDPAGNCRKKPRAKRIKYQVE